MKAIVLDSDAKIPYQTPGGTGYGHRILREFLGPQAYEEAVAFIGTLPDHERGRYWLDRCITGEGHCQGCDCK